jgi:hypothetical protein
MKPAAWQADTQSSTVFAESPPATDINVARVGPVDPSLKILLD